MDPRERDPLRTLPPLPFPLTTRRASGGLTSGSLRVTWRRTARTIAAIKSMATGCANGWLSPAPLKAEEEAKERWTSSSPLQRKIISDIWDRHAKRAGWGNINDGQAALSRLRETAGSGYFSTTRRLTTSKAASPSEVKTFKKGDLCPLHAEQVSLPSPGTVPLRVQDLSCCAGSYIDSCQTLMIRSAGEVDWEKYESTKSYSDPALRSKTEKLELLSRMYQAGMLTYVKEVKEKVGLFTVAKDIDPVSGQVLKSRLIWDCRKVNILFHDPPWVPLGSPAGLALLELDEMILRGRRLFSFQGDVPDWFYRLHWGSELAEFFVVEGVSPQELHKYAESKGLHFKEPSSSDTGLGAESLVMGSAWAVFLAHTCLEASFESLKAPTLTYGKPTPSFGTSAELAEKLILLLYIDDYIGLTLAGPEGEETIVRDKEEVKAILNGKGLAIHKEDWGEGLAGGLGLTIPSSRPYTLRVQTKKFSELVLATEALILEEVACPSVLASLVGHWTWTMMVFRPAFAILDETYRWIREYEEEEACVPHRIPTVVKHELSAVAALSIYMESDLEAPWWPRAYMTDASDEGYGSLACDCTTEELREEAARGTEGLWGPQVEEVYTELEREVETAGDEEDLPAHPRAGRPGVLELFSGSSRLLDAIRECTDSWGEAWDISEGGEYDVLVSENLELLLRRLRQGWYWWVHIAPPCATFSKARSPPLRSGEHIWGLPYLDSGSQAKLDEGNLLCLVAVEVARLCLRLAIPFTLENPAGSFIWSFPPLLEVLEKEEIWRVEMDYCMYGEMWKKPTAFITSVKEMTSLSRRCTGSFWSCGRTKEPHQELRGRAPCGLRWTQLACAYPLELCKSYAEIVQRLEPSWESMPSGARLRLRGGRTQIVKSAGPTIPLDASWLNRKWHVLFAGRWSHHEHNNVLELRTVVATLRHLSRTSQAWGHRILIFTDSLVSLGALQKGRSSAKDLLHLCRIGAITQMVCRIRGYYRWVPSELNLADGPSRGLGIGAAEETVKVHKARGVPQRLQQLLRQRHDRGQGAAGPSHL